MRARVSISFSFGLWTFSSQILLTDISEFRHSITAFLPKTLFSGGFELCESLGVKSFFTNSFFVSLGFLENLELLKSLASLEYLELLSFFESLSSLENLEDLESLSSLENLEDLESLSSIENLESLKLRESFENLEAFGYLELRESFWGLRLSSDFCS
ncbi:MAG: hypothetical protein RLZZ361_714 [Cyanobacteriota bacterium]